MPEEPIEPPAHPPPRRPRIQTFRDFVIELATITAGVFIALSIEGLREWNHNRTLVREARTTIAREVADNLRDVEATLKDLEAQRKDLAAAVQLAEDYVAAGKSDVQKINVGAALSDLSAASWESAERTGALAHMEYDEVRKWAHLYAFQDLYAQQQRKVLERAAAAMSLFAREGDPTKWPRGDFEQFRQQVVALGADATMQEQLGRHLAQLYRKALPK